MIIGPDQYRKQLDRRTLSREAPWGHRVRLFCERGSDGKCTHPLCQRRIGLLSRVIDGEKPVDAVKEDR